MSVSKPMQKRVHHVTPATLTRADPNDPFDVAAKDPLTVSTLSPMSSQTTSETSEETKRKALPSHPKGHRVRPLADVWGAMTQDFLRITDTLTLGDVWLQPIAAMPLNATGNYVNVDFHEIVFAPHIKVHRVSHKMSSEDLLYMLYLTDRFSNYIDGESVDELNYETWYKMKAGKCVAQEGPGATPGMICSYVMVNDPEFSFYLCGGRMGMFFRKINYHSYKNTDPKITKLDNPSMVKCKASRGKFDYMIEARLIPLPANWNSVALRDEEEEGEVVPDTQPL